MDAKQYAKIGLYPIKSIKEDFYPLLTTILYINFLISNL